MTGNPAIPYHDRHEPYIAAVRAAFDAAGITTLDHYADPNDPRDGAIKLDPAVCDGWVRSRGVWAGWQEERGWWLLTVAEQASSDGRYVYPLGVATIASPETVVKAVAEQTGLDIDVPGDDWPDVDFPDHEQDDDEDPVFEAALLAYVPGGAR